MRKVILINPWIHDFSAYDLWLKPLGLLIVANWLKPYFDVTLIDCMDQHAEDRRYGTGKFPYRVIAKPSVYSWVPRNYKQYGIPEDEFVRRLMEADIVGITSTMTYWYPGVSRAVELVQENLGDVPIILGGIYARLCKAHAERTMGVRVSDAWTRKEVLREFGIDCDDEGDSAPDYSHYERLSSAATITQLGCPFKCTYCASPILFNKMTFRNPVEVAAEIDGLAARGIRDVAFYDDALLMGYRRNLGQVLANLKSRIRLHTPNAIHARAVTPEVAREMKQAGFRTIRIGLETSDDRRQEHASNGKITNSQFVECIENLREAGFDTRDVAAYVMAGLPDQSTEEILDTFTFVHECGVRISVSMFTPVPGTPEFDVCVRKHGLDPDEPLLANKTIYGGVNNSRYFELERIRVFANELNDRLGSGVGSDRILND